MTAKYHVNKAGEPGLCSAQAGNCPFGGEDNHYDSVEQARAAYEKSQNIVFPTKVPKVMRQALRGAESLGELSSEGSGPGSISYHMDFDRVLAKGDKNDFYAPEGIYAPDVSFVTDERNTRLGDGWTLITSGMSGQQGYSGPWLHDSELIEGPVAREISRGAPGYYVALAGYSEDVDDDSYAETVPLGWAIAYRPYGDDVPDDPTLGGFIPNPAARPF